MRTREPGQGSGQSCPMCGAPVGPAMSACESCPVGGSCEVLCCARCGYRFVEKSVVWDFFRSLARRFGKRGRAGAGGGKEAP